MNILKKVLSNKYFYISVIILLVIFLIRSCRTPIENYDQNIKALTDSVRFYKSKNGELVYEKTAFISKQNELSQLNKDLVNEIKELKDNPIVVIKTKFVIVHDTVEIEVNSGDYTYNEDNTIKSRTFDWKLDTAYDSNNYRTLHGDYIVSVDSNINITTTDFRLMTDEIGIGLATGLTEGKDNNVEIFITSTYPGFKPTNIDGALFDPRESEVIKKYFPPKRWSLSPFVGYGVYVDIANGRVGTGAAAGISVSYALFQWNFKKK